VPRGPESTLDELTSLDATAQAELVRSGEVSAVELAESAIERIERLNGELNAVILTLYERGRAAAERVPAGPFAGVPFLLKDISAELAGTPISEGSRFAEGFVSTHDQELVARYKRAGLVILGKTNTPEFGILPTTEPRAFGATRNPWETARSSGGSSGGAAAAVASGMVAAAHASDGGGSIRIPASCCGVFGLKPTRARVTHAPAHGDVYGGLVCNHALTRSVRDSAALLDVAAGPAPGDPYAAPPQARPYVEEVGADPGRLRIAVVTDSLTGVPVDRDCVEAARAAARLCEQLGHEVVEITPQIDAEVISASFIRVWAAGNASTMASWAQRTGRNPSEDLFEPLTWALAAVGREVSGSDYLLAWEELHRASRRIAGYFEHHDVWIGPVLSEPPLPLGSFEGPPDEPLFGLGRAAAYAPFTALANITGQPAMSVPLHWNAGGLPIGSHFVGRFGDEATLFRLAAQLEQAQPWAGRRPPASA
jgi:amidase